MIALILFLVRVGYEKARTSSEINALSASVIKRFSLRQPVYSHGAVIESEVASAGIALSEAIHQLHPDMPPDHNPASSRIQVTFR
jgi:hypothetical protein